LTLLTFGCPAYNWRKISEACKTKN